MSVRILTGDCRAVLATLPAESVHCVVTSPPYFGLRDYGTATWEGGELGCDHLAPPRRGSGTYTKASTLGPKRDGLGPDNAAWRVTEQQFGEVCGKCGARRIDSQIGLEPSPDEYVATLVEVFRSVRRVLRKDGTVWLNLGDSYANDGKWGGSSGGKHVAALHGNSGIGRGKKATGAKPKDLLMIPARVALALQADGWWLRSDIIWSKPNPMPESVIDRPTSAHEHVFLLAKSERYFFDADAVREPAVSFGRQHTTGVQPPKVRALQEDGTHGTGGDLSVNYEREERNIRNVWTIATQPYSGAHFATFPPALVEPCIKAGTSERGCCSECGAPWIRVTEKSRTFESGSGRAGNMPNGKNGPSLQGGGETLDIRRGPVVHVETTGWEPSCECISWHCIQCPTVLDCLHGESDPERTADTGAQLSEQVHLVPIRVSRMEARQSLVQPSVSGQLACEKSADHQRLDDHKQGLSDAYAPTAPECDSLRVCDGTSTRDGDGAWSLSDGGRGGPSFERRQAGQQPGEPGGNGQASARRRKKARIPRDLSSLSQDIPGARQCSHCGSCLEAVVPQPVPCTVLDCFGGAGTVGLVADRLQRNAILVELNPAYASMAEQRIHNDAPLLGAVA